MGPGVTDARLPLGSDDLGHFEPYDGLCPGTRRSAAHLTLSLASVDCPWCLAKAEEDPEGDRLALVREAEETGLCPLHGIEMACESSHERDSTHDRFSCPACGWSYSQQEAWAAERVP